MAPPAVPKVDIEQPPPALPNVTATGLDLPPVDISPGVSPTIGALEGEAAVQHGSGKRKKKGKVSLGVKGSALTHPPLTQATKHSQEAFKN